ncbi:MAG: adenylate/guanylate cyclase domain-containing protein [Candidatus Eremiobacteraeota bacterium]|nr:adenylate/guanylate cyclase domain-containing protein [Candidatus Eremiobacteraeota bacterium]
MCRVIPTGRVAFLFTDVEGSTRRWERYGEAMRDALRRHDRILRARLESCGGYVFKTVGDAFCAAFPTASEALEAAVEAQRQLDREDFTAVDGLFVRMAVDVGETDERDGDYFGIAVNRAARLLGAGHGGQILLSGDAADLALARLPIGVTLRHLGVLPLRDIKEPERVYQPMAEGLRSEFEPLRALKTPPNNLPRQTTSFVGRYDDIARVESLLDAGPLVTLVGAGGIGKTRLALEVGAGRLNDRRDGVWFVDLSSVGDAALIAGTILSAVGAEPSSEGDPLADLVSYLQKRELLLLVDNSEHLVSDVAVIVSQLIDRCPHLAILATSRSPLDISAERVYRLSSLDRDAALKLFADRALAANPSFQLEPQKAVIEAICDRLDGIALAIELAAARIRTMSVETLASHLELRLLSGGRDRRPRQQTMRALIDWSYDLLNDDERRGLRRVSVFQRGFTLGAATAVLGDAKIEQWRVLELLASLVDKSLVLQSEGRDERYRLLEPIREYAWEKLVEAGETDQTRRLHASAIASLAAQWYDEWDRGPGFDWMTRVEDDLANLRAALRWSVDEGNDLELGAKLTANATIVFLRLGLFVEGAESCRRVLQTGVALPVAVEARLRYGLSTLCSTLGAEEQCLDQASLSLALYRQAGDVRGTARALSQVASRSTVQGRLDDDAKSAAREALQLARQSGDRRFLADILRRCAESFADDGEEAVRARFGESVELFRALGRNAEVSRALQWWGNWENSIGNHGGAADRLLQAAQIDDREELSIFLTNDIASAYLAAGDRARAEPFARRSLALATNARHEVLASLAIAFLAAIEKPDDARKSARLIGHAQERLRVAGWKLLSPDDATIASLHEALKREIDDAELSRLLSEGAAWTDDQAVAAALAL